MIFAAASISPLPYSLSPGPGSDAEGGVSNRQGEFLTSSSAPSLSSFTPCTSSRLLRAHRIALRASSNDALSDQARQSRKAHAIVPAAQIAPEDMPSFASLKRGAGDPQERAQGKPGASRTRSLVCKMKNTRVSHHRYAEAIRPSLRNGFNGLLRALPGDRAFLPPSPV